MDCFRRIRIIFLQDILGDGLSVSEVSHIVILTLGSTVLQRMIFRLWSIEYKQRAAITVTKPISVYAPCCLQNGIKAR
jgi:hypothetical protein